VLVPVARPAELRIDRPKHERFPRVASRRGTSGQRVTASSPRCLGCNLEHGRWPHVGDRYLLDLSTRERAVQRFPPPPPRWVREFQKQMRVRAFRYWSSRRKRSPNSRFARASRAR
jgi:hypothetical protein